MFSTKKEQRVHSLAAFFNDASAKEKKAVYTEVLRRASDSQSAMVVRANEKIAQSV